MTVEARTERKRRSFENNGQITDQPGFQAPNRFSSNAMFCADGQGSSNMVGQDSGSSIAHESAFAYLLLVAKHLRRARD